MDFAGLICPGWWPTGRFATQKVVDIGRQAGEINQIRSEPPRSSLRARRGPVWGICFRWVKVP